eukprot:Ihof_evm6s288 gene=Ihof_evmTU6s288
MAAAGLESFPLTSPYAGMKIASHEAIRETSAMGRQLCPRCKRSRKLYCYSCHVPMMKDPASLPRVHLPLSCDIIKHKQEKDSKSTAVHAKLADPDNVTIYTFPEFPQEYDQEKTVLLFPSQDASTFDEVGDLSSITKAVFVDCTWQQTYGITTHPALKGLRKIRLNAVNTLFWRTQEGFPDTYLATIEAIYQFFRQYHISMASRSIKPIGPVTSNDALYNGRYDNLLYFFSYQYGLIQEAYLNGPYGTYKDLKLNKSGYIDHSR